MQVMCEVCSLAVVTVCFNTFVQDVQLEREKQQQMVLLQELEDQKAKLEQMLQEAQQEREHLKAAVTQEVPINRPEVPVQDQEVTRGLEVDNWLNFKALIFSQNGHKNISIFLLKSNFFMAIA